MRRRKSAAQIHRENLAREAQITRLQEQRERIAAIRDGPLLLPSELLDKLEAQALEKLREEQE